MNKSQENKLQGVLFALAMALYLFFAFSLERYQFSFLFIIYLFLFVFYNKLCSNKNNYAFTLGLLVRVAFLFSIPNLSQDIYRFIWDGRIFLEGINPLTSKPVDLQHLPNAAWFISKMGNLSASNYSNYPPFSQYVFAVAAFFGKGNIAIEMFILKLFLCVADVVTYIFGKKILQKLEIDANKIMLYFLNPLVIIEGCGNAHFEVLMVAFFCVSLYCILLQKQVLAALFIALSIATKLIPLFYVATFFRFNLIFKNIRFYIVLGLTLLVLFLPFVNSHFFQNYSYTIGLWFGKFEFNASLYYVMRELGYMTLGYNINGLYGKVIILVLGLVLLWQILKHKSISISNGLLHFQTFLMFYFLTSSTVHPWYLTTLLFLNIFHKRTSVLLWSFTIILSYFAYKNSEFKEYPLVLIIEYGLVWPLFILETIKMYRNIEDTSKTQQ